MVVDVFYQLSASNDPRPQMIPGPEMIPGVDRKWSRWKTRNGMEFVSRVVVMTNHILYGYPEIPR